MKKSARNWKWWLPFYIMMLPGMFYFLVNNYLPMAGIVVAFKKVNYRLGIFASPWNGVKNFEFLFKSGAVGTMVRNTVLYNMAFILIDTVLAIAVAILLNEIRKKYASRIYQTLILLPYLMSMVIVSYLAFAFLILPGASLLAVYPDVCSRVERHRVYQYRLFCGGSRDQRGHV